MKALPLRQSKYLSCDMTQKVNTTAADKGSSFFKASETLHADLAKVVSFSILLQIKFPSTQNRTQIGVSELLISWYKTPTKAILYYTAALYKNWPF